MWKSLAKKGAALSGALLFVVSGCGQSAPPQPAPQGPSPASQAWLKLANAFIEDYMLAQPAFAVHSGRHEFDGRLPDLSAHGIKREIARLHDARDQIAAVDAGTLQARRRFDREYLLAVVDKDLFWIEKTQFPFTNPGWYLDQIDPDIYLSRKLCTARSAHEGVHQVRAGHPEDRRLDQGKPQIAHAQDLRRAGDR